VSRFCPGQGFDDGAQRLSDVRAKVTFSRRVTLYKEIDTKEPDETDGDGDGTNWRLAMIRRGSGREEGRSSAITLDSHRIISPSRSKY
jgi:hypothetical protein